MTNTTARRIIAGASAGALAAGLTATIGAGAAVAAPNANPDSIDSHGFQFTRTVDDATPQVGDTIHITTDVSKSSGTGARLYALKDVHPSCLVFADDADSVVVDGQNETRDHVSFADQDPNWPDIGWVKVA